MSSRKTIRIVSLSIILLVLVVAVVLKTGLFSFGAEKEKSSETSASSAGPSNEVLGRGTVVKKSKLVDRIRVTGTVLPNEEVELTTEVGGIITQINFQEGQQIAQGALLVKINASDLQAQLERLEAQAELYKNREYRQKKLLERGGVSQDEYDAVLSELNALKAQIKEVRARILKTEIRAPFSGTVGLRNVSKGSFVNPGTSIVRLVNISKLKIEFSAPEKYMNKLNPGQTVNIISELNKETYQGKIYAIEPKINLDTRTLTARAILNNSDRSLMPGAFVNVEIILKEYDDALQVPAIAVIPELGGQKVYLYRDGKAEDTPIQTGIRTEKKVQVTEGLQPGDTIISSGLLNIRPGVKVKLQEVN